MELVQQGIVAAIGFLNSTLPKPIISDPQKLVKFLNPIIEWLVSRLHKTGEFTMKAEKA